MLFVHATGFLAALWHPIATRFTGQCRILALDLRGHGDSDPGDSYHWSTFPDDLGGVLAALNLAPAVLVGHSVGGAASALCAARYPQRVAGLVLVDPVIYPESFYGRPEAATESDLFRRAERRRRWWPSREEMRASLAGRPPFDSWRAEIFDLYVQEAVTDAPDGGVRLKCAPETEAAIYRETLRYNFWPELARVGAPAVVLRGVAERGLRSTTTSDLASHLALAEDRPVETAGHLVPMEDPDAVVAGIEWLLGRLGHGPSEAVSLDDQGGPAPARP